MCLSIVYLSKPVISLDNLETNLCYLMNTKFISMFLFKIDALRGSSDFFGLNHYTTYLMSPSNMEKKWKVPSLDHDTGVKMEQNPSWAVPGPTWLSVS